RIRVHGLHDVLAKIAWMGRGVAHAANSRYFGDAPEQGGEVPIGQGWIAIAVDVLPQELDLAVTFRGQSAGFFHHTLAGAAALRAARERHHAVGATLVAAFDDGDVSAVRIVAAGEGRVEGRVGIQAQSGDVPAAAFDLHQQFAQLVVTGRAAHQPYVRRAFENAFALLLCHAAEHANDLVLAAALELLQAMVHLLLGFIAYAARIVEHQPGLFRRGNPRVALGDQ